MKLDVVVVMDPIASIRINKDSTFAMLLEAQRRGHTLYYAEQSGLYLRHGRAWAEVRALSVRDEPAGWFELDRPQMHPLSVFDVVLMRKDPPFNMDYIYSTYILEAAAAEGALVVNDPRSLRDYNEKLATGRFPECSPPSLVSSRHELLKEFLQEHGEIVVKPLDGMGGESIFRLQADDPNLNVILETLTLREHRLIMAQRFIPEYIDGDKRLLLIDGQPVPYALARIPAAGETRANLAVGGRGEGVELNARDHWICQQVGPYLRARGILFAGLDVIGDYLTEVNITSPTCIRELDARYGINISAELFECIEQRRADQQPE